MRLKCRTRPRLSLLAISALQTLQKLLCETGSAIFRHTSPDRHVVKTELKVTTHVCLRRASQRSNRTTNMAPTELAQDAGGTKINLSMLIDFLLQKTYHELTVLSEL